LGTFKLRDSFATSFTPTVPKEPPLMLTGLLAAAQTKLRTKQEVSAREDTTSTIEALSGSVKL
jgi:hypothetical protein